MVSPQNVAVKGDRYQATIPDTLDLADRGKLALNVLTKNPDPTNYYRLWQTMEFDANPPRLRHPNWLTYKFIESLPMMRVMSGDLMNLDTESEMMRVHLGQIGDEGLIYEPPGATFFMSADVAAPTSNGRMILAMLAWHQRDGDPAWLDHVDRMNQALADIAIYRHDYAYHPPESGYIPGKGWVFTSRPGKAHFPYTPPGEPSREQQGIEGTIKENASVLRAAARWYQISGDPKALEYARKLANFYVLPNFWEDGFNMGIAGHEHGLFAGHFHGNLIGVRGLLSLAIAARDEGLKQFVRETYEYARLTGISRMGWFPGWMTPERFGRPFVHCTTCEGCGIADMVALAVNLSDAGVLDCWDDVDHYARNQLIEQQASDPGLLLAASQAGEPVDAPPAEKDAGRIIDRCLGGFSGFGKPTRLPNPAFHGCCTGNGTQALYYAWEGITRFRNGGAQVNLLLNRAAPWLDIESYLPYEGKVIVRNKQATTLSVRIPGWVDRNSLTFQLNGQPAAPWWAGNYVVFGGLRPKDTVQLDFLVPEDQATYTVAGTHYSCKFRGSTLVDISSPEESAGVYPLYQRKHLLSDRAPMKTVERFASSVHLGW